jgi:DNA-binding LacI/PurR family transcriptional regulator
VQPSLAKPISLKELASHLELSQSTVSRIVNGGGTAHRIAKETQERVLQAAERYGYSANSVARSLRQKRTYTIGVIVPEISEGYSTAILSGIEDELLKDGFFYFVVSHRHRADLLRSYPRMLVARSVEGIIAVDTPLEHEVPVPLVSVSGQQRHEGSINIELHHEQAAHLALEHLQSLGHTRVAFIKGQSLGSDTDRRWHAIVGAAAKLGIEIQCDLVVQLDGAEPGPGLGMEVTRALLKAGRGFSAIFAFNDVTAIGAMLALREAGMRVPEDVSVLGFDDVLLAGASNPLLTTIHHPLRAMGQTAAATLLGLIRDDIPEPREPVIMVHPSLVARESTGRASVHSSVMRAI